MIRNQSGQKIYFLMRTTSSAIQAIVSMANKTVVGASTGNITITTSTPHGLIPGNRVEISGVGGNTTANGTFQVFSVPTTTTFTICNSVGTQVSSGLTYTSGGTVVCLPVNVFVSKNGQDAVMGTGTLTHVGKGPLGIAHVPDANQLRALAAITSTTSIAGATAVAIASGGINASTYGLWCYTPTASEINASQVSFTFTAAAVNAIAVVRDFEPAVSPGLSTTINTVTSQRIFTLAAGSSLNDIYNNWLVLITDQNNEYEVAYGVVSGYVGSSKQITLKHTHSSSGYTIAGGDHVTLSPPTTERKSVVYGIAGGGSATTMSDANRTESDNYWKGNLIIFTSGTLKGVCRVITEFTASNDTFRFQPALPVAVAGGLHEYEIHPMPSNEPYVLFSGSVASVASQTQYTLQNAVSSSDNSAYPAGSLVIVRDAATSSQICVGVVAGYVGSTRTLTLLADPGVFTVAAGDMITILAAKSRSLVLA